MTDQIELYFHAGELALIIFGMALPLWIAAVQMRRILRDFPPHRHTQNGGIIFPAGYDPPDEQPLSRSATAGR